MEYLSYNSFARDYHLKRKKAWKPLENYFDILKERKYKFKGNCLDLGCANGRHFKIFKNPSNKLIGIDNSQAFLKIALESLRDSLKYSKSELLNIQLILGDLNYIPIRAKCIQNIFSIAAIHHIKGKSKRKNVIKQLFDLLSKNGYFFFTVWRRWQKKFKKSFMLDWLKRIFNQKYKKQQKKKGLKEFGDKFIPWTVSHEKYTYNRFYHFFSKNEIKKLLKIFKIIEFQIIGGPTNKDNFFILAQK